MRFEPPKLFAANDVAPPPGPNRLLALPRELRDIIYKYALTEDQGLLLIERRVSDDDPKSFKGCRPTDPGVKSNRLKYVCRQLYHETKGLGSGLNDIAFQSEQQLEDFAAFLTTCSVGQQQCIRKVTLCTSEWTIIDPLAEWDLLGSDLATYSTSHPQMNFHLFIGHLNKDLPGEEWLDATDYLYAKHRHANHFLVPDNLRRAIQTTHVFDDHPELSSQVRMFPGAGPGHVTRPVFSDEAIRTWGASQVKTFLEEIEKWQRDGI